ncbi:UBX domain-containing protein 4 isoform X1 [Cimex lectularius]|uniref:UBX domain-containing protein 4 n=1 Tax=Cimex lectularius TaxID=79782 RepID=A0A8I6RGD7_CIMLE|nr:UBX domain-containing protein 4 isoform X1 [Cimex lectularius]
MNWFEGTIAEAVSSSKRKKAIFVVYVEGTDEASTSMSQILNGGEVAKKLDPSKFVCIRLEKGSPSHKQFTDIYKLVPVPSVFFIGHKGEPLEIVVGSTQNSVEEKICVGIETCINYLQGSVPLGEAVGDSSIPAPSSSNIHHGDLGQFIKMESQTTENAGKPPTVEQTSTHETTHKPEEPEGMSMDQKVERAKLLLARKNEQKRQEELEKEKEAELERRRIGQELQKANQLKQEMELKQFMEERKKERREEAEAKKKILDQIAEDRVARAQRMAMSSQVVPDPAVASASTAPSTSPPPSNVNIARLQFKLPTGEAKTHTFPAETTLGQVRQFIDNNIVLPFSEYQMATMFPRREFTHRDNNIDLRALQLLPSAVILILPVTGSQGGVLSGPSWTQICIDMFWDMVKPLFTLSRYIQSYLFGRPPPSNDNAPGWSSNSNQGQAPTTVNSGVFRRLFFANKRKSGIRRRGNVHTLADEGDSNDENNTWNGNSTQQM